MDWNKYKLNLIKAVRDITGIGLRESKEVVEKWIGGSSTVYRDDLIAELRKEIAFLKKKLEEKDEVIQSLAAGVKRLLGTQQER